MSNDGPTLVKMPRIQKELAQCQMCGYCIDVCEAHRQTPWESVTARGKIYYLNQLDKAGTGKMDKLLGRKVTLSPEFVDAMYKCTGCGNCEEVCHAKIELVALWEKIRTWMARYGVAPLPVHKKLEASIAKNGNPYGEPKSKRDAWWPEEVKRVTPPDAVFFAGCTGSYRMQGIPKAAVKVLDRAGVSLNCLGENEVCCTSPLLRTGIDLQTLEAAKETVTKADGIGAKDMIMSCSGCYKTVSSNFVEYYGKPGQNVYHITQYVDKLIAQRKLALPNEFKAKVTYHDPCHLGRHSKVFEEPRNILKKIKGIDFVEMDRNRENSRCCGAGGGYKSAFNDFAVNIAAERIRDAEKVGADIIATACPFCVLNLRAGAKKINSKIKVMDITEILLQVTDPEGPKVIYPVGEPPKAVEPEPEVKEEPKAVAPVAPAVEEKKEEPVADTKNEVPPVEEEPKEEPVEEPKEEEVVEETVDETEEEDDGEDYDFDFAVTPEDIVRRAAWNKGLRCRRNYGPYNIPVAFVKSKVAVIVGPEGDLDKAKLEEEGWAVLHFDEEKITDGAEEAALIKNTVKENLRALKKKKTKKKK